MHIFSPAYRSPRGMTLVELLVALGVSLLLVLGLTQYFKFVGDTVANGRAVIEMASQVYSTTQRLEQELKQVSPLARPGSDQAAAAGYLEVVEGPVHDFSATLVNPASSILGDVDDIVAMMCVSERVPFSGQLLYTAKVYDPTTGKTRYTLDLTGAGPYQYEALRSRHAEVVYWLTPDKNTGVTQQTYTLHRRNLLVLPNIELDPASYGQLALQELFNIADLSCHFTAVNGPPRWVANTPEDLTRRENRFAHVGNFPSAMLAPASMPVQSDMTIRSIPVAYTARRGEDIALSHVLAFDVRVYDPTAFVLASANSGVDAVSPGDVGFVPAITANRPVIGRGAFVDLAYGRNFTLPANRRSLFYSLPDARSGLAAFGVYDTWSTSYERDGTDQDNALGVDQGTDGLPNNATGGVDDVSELETVPPYSVPLRGIQIILRVIDQDSRQIQQAIVATDFTPE